MKVIHIFKRLQFPLVLHAVLSKEIHVLLVVRLRLHNSFHHFYRTLHALGKVRKECRSIFPFRMNVWLRT